VNLAIDGHRIDGAYVIPIMDAVPSGDYIEFVHVIPEYPPISRRLLTLHGAIAEVLHMIGAGEAIDRILWELERINFLDPNGTDAKLLDGRLQMIMAV
jgi:hypothetical protein